MKNIRLAIFMIFMMSLFMGCNDRFIDSNVQVFNPSSSIEKSIISGSYYDEEHNKHIISEIGPGIYKYLEPERVIVSPLNLSEKQINDYNKVKGIEKEMRKNIITKIIKCKNSDKNLQDCISSEEKKYYKDFKVYLKNLDREMVNFENELESFYSGFPTKVVQNSLIFSLYDIGDEVLAAEVTDINMQDDLADGEKDRLIDNVDKNSIVLIKLNRKNNSIGFFEKTYECLSNKNQDNIIKYKIGYLVTYSGEDYTQYKINKKPEDEDYARKFLLACTHAREIGGVFYNSENTSSDEEEKPVKPFLNPYKGLPDFAQNVDFGDYHPNKIWANVPMNMDGMCVLSNDSNYIETSRYKGEQSLYSDGNKYLMLWLDNQEETYFYFLGDKVIPCSTVE